MSYVAFGLWTECLFIVGEPFHFLVLNAYNPNICIFFILSLQAYSTVLLDVGGFGGENVSFFFDVRVRDNFCLANEKNDLVLKTSLPTLILYVL